LRFVGIKTYIYLAQLISSFDLTEFADMMNYMGSPVSLRDCCLQLLKVDETKVLIILIYLKSVFSVLKFKISFQSHFPYAWVDDKEKLRGPLPHYGAFKDCNGKNMLDADWLAYRRKVEESGEENAGVVPLKGRQLHAQLMTEWTAKGYKTLLDVLRGYNARGLRISSFNLSFKI